MKKNDIDFLRQNDFIEDIKSKIGLELWTTVYSGGFQTDSYENKFIYCALIPREKIEECLNREQWDLSIGDELPSCSQYSDGTIEYEHFYDCGSIQPLVLIRDFYGVKPQCIEILEEFRLYHNLYFDNKSNKYIKISNDGSEEEIVILESELVKIKTKAIRQFLSMKEMYLAVFFDSRRHIASHYDETQEEVERNYKDSSTTYSLYVGKDDFTTYAYYSRLCGKKLIAPLSKGKGRIWPYDESNKNYESFIIDVDEDGDDITFCCNPDKLANYFGANPDAPHYLTPVFFKREVLGHYYSSPEKFSVEDGLIRCGGLWSLQIDNNHEKYVTVFLGDLGKLSHSNQLHWKLFNIQPDGKISSVNFKRSFLAQFTNSEKADLVFKAGFNSFQKKWHKKFGWHLFKPLAHDDEHFFTALRIPLTNEQSEFDSQVLALTKIMIDSLNEKDIVKKIANIDKNSKGITKFETFLQVNDVSNYEVVIKFFRNLQDLRSSGVGHRKGDNYKKISKIFGINDKELTKVFEEILTDAKGSIDILEGTFLML